MFVAEFQVVFTQVCILFLLILVGFVCQKMKLLTEEGNRCIADIVMYIVTPCVIIRSFQREFDFALLKGFLITCGIAAVMHIAMILLSKLPFHREISSRRSVLRFGMVFSNCGFIGLPLAQAILGNDGVFYVSAFIVVFNVFVWSWGLMTIQGSTGSIKLRKLVLNPGIIGVAIGMLVFLTSVKLPEIVSSSVNYMAELNVPLPMLLVGYYLGKADVKSALRDKQAYVCIAFRMIILPLLTLLVLWFCGVSGTLLIACMVCAAAPVGTMTTIFSAKYHGDTQLSVSLVSISTLLSLITMPIILALAQIV